MGLGVPALLEDGVETLHGGDVGQGQIPDMDVVPQTRCRRGSDSRYR